MLLRLPGDAVDVDRELSTDLVDRSSGRDVVGSTSGAGTARADFTTFSSPKSSRAAGCSHCDCERRRASVSCAMPRTFRARRSRSRPAPSGVARGRAACPGRSGSGRSRRAARARPTSERPPAAAACARTACAAGPSVRGCVERAAVGRQIQAPPTATMSSSPPTRIKISRATRS